MTIERDYTIVDGEIVLDEKTLKHIAQRFAWNKQIPVRNTKIIFPNKVLFELYGGFSKSIDIVGWLVFEDDQPSIALRKLLNPAINDNIVKFDPETMGIFILYSKTIDGDLIEDEEAEFISQCFGWVKVVTKAGREITLDSAIDLFTTYRK